MFSISYPKNRTQNRTEPSQPHTPGWHHFPVCNTTIYGMCCANTDSRTASHTWTDDMALALALGWLIGRTRMGGWVCNVCKYPQSYRPSTPIVLPFLGGGGGTGFNVLMAHGSPGLTHPHSSPARFLYCVQCFASLALFPAPGPHPGSAIGRPPTLHPPIKWTSVIVPRDETRNQQKEKRWTLLEAINGWADWSGYQKTRCQKGSVLRSVTDWIDWEGLKVNINYVSGGRPNNPAIKHRHRSPWWKIIPIAQACDGKTEATNDNQQHWQRRCRHSQRHHSVSQSQNDAFIGPRSLARTNATNTPNGDTTKTRNWNIAFSFITLITCKRDLLHDK